jgi:hypothetical protein
MFGELSRMRSNWKRIGHEASQLQRYLIELFFVEDFFDYYEVLISIGFCCGYFFCL